MVKEEMPGIGQERGLPSNVDVKGLREGVLGYTEMEEALMNQDPGYLELAIQTLEQDRDQLNVTIDQYKIRLENLRQKQQDQG